MGNVSNKDIEYRAYTLGDIGVIELLLLYRYKYDENMFLKSESTFLAVNGVMPVNEEVVVTYATLDKYIELCKFDEVQMKMLELLSHGYTYEEIAEIMNLHRSAIPRRFMTMYRRIIKENEWQWKLTVYDSKLGLRKKTCSKCKVELPGTVEFFSNDKRNIDGFQGQCRKCKL